MPERSRSSCEEWLAASIPSAFSLFLGHSALAETTATFERLTTSGGRTTLGSQTAPLDAGSPISVESGVQVLLEGSVEYHISNGVCTFTSSGSYSAASNPDHGMLSYGILDHTVQSSDACNGKTFPYAVVYYTWTDNQSGATQDSFAVQWQTPDGMMGGPYGYTVQLNQNLGIAFNGQNIAGTTPQTVYIGQQIALTGSPSPSVSQSQNWNVTGANNNANNPVGGYTPTPADHSTGHTISLNYEGQTTTFYWSVPGDYQVSYSPTPGGTPVTANFSVVGPNTVNVSPSLGEIQVLGKRTIGFGNSSGVPGITFNETSTPPTPPPNNAGLFTWVQIIRRQNVHYLSPGTGDCTLGLGLDNYYPYPAETPTSTSDSPSNTFNRLFSSADSVFTAQMYLMWDPLTTQSIPVPLGSLQWAWSVDVMKDDNGQWGIVAGTGKVGPIGHYKPDNTFPTWDKVSLNGHPKCH